MPDSDFSDHPLVRSLNDTIDALTYLREDGVKKVPLDPDIWKAFITQPAASTIRLPAATALGMPAVPEPSRAERSPAPSPEGINPERDTPDERLRALAILQQDIASCKGCPCAGDRITGQGNPYNPRLAVVNGPWLAGESPAAIGSRLEGPAGELFDKMFAAIGLTRADCYITPALKCPVTGRPTAADLNTCARQLHKELRLVNPQVIVMLGPVASRTLFPTGVFSTGKVGQWSLVENHWPAIVLHHPMRILMTDASISVEMKRENWAALQAVRDRLAKNR